MVKNLYIGVTMKKKTWPDLVFSGDTDPSILSRAAKRGTLRRMASGVYTSILDADPEVVVRQHLLQIVGHELPGAVIVDRSARSAGPVDGHLFVDHPRRRPLQLPGLTIVTRRGPGHVEGDMEMPDGLWIASTARQLLDNLNKGTRGKGRVMGELEVEEWVDTLLNERGEDGLNKLRDQARQIATILNRQREFERLDAMIGAALSTGDAHEVRSERLRARLAGQPFDARRTAMFERLASDLLSRAPETMPALAVDDPRRRLLPFYEAYFSNYIEGTEFTLDEAGAIVFEEIIPVERPADAHDVLGTYAVVSDLTEMSRTPQSLDEFENLLRTRHARIMAYRPNKLPGQYKVKSNRAGGTEFVAPELVVGTLRRGYEIGSSLTSPFARAVYVKFVTAEVHPFTDGNGRVSRIMMNAELVTAGEVRIVVPIVYRANYLSAMRAATNSGNFAAMYAMLEFARRYTAQVDFSSRENAEADFDRTNALRDSTEAEYAGLRLALPNAESSL
jgi:hypothetical protein